MGVNYIKHYGIGVILLILFSLNATSQTIKFISDDGDSTEMNLSSIEKIVYEQENLVVTKTDCGEEFYTIFLNQSIILNENGSMATNVEMNVSGDILLYPNPATTYITMDFSEMDNSYGYIQNILGQVVKEFRFTGQSLTLNISDIPSGFYFVSIQNKTTKFIKY